MREGGFFKYWTERRAVDLKCITMSNFWKPELEVPIVFRLPLKGKMRHMFEIYAIGNFLAMVWFMGTCVHVYGSKYFKRVLFF